MRIGDVEKAEVQVGEGGRVGETGDVPEGRGGAGAVSFGAELGGREYVLGLLDCLDLGNDDAGAGVEGVADGCVVVSGYPGEMCKD